MTIECWTNPLHSIEDRYEMAIGAIDFRDRIIKNLRGQIEELKKQKLIEKLEDSGLVYNETNNL
jgi:hypothetical protein